VLLDRDQKSMVSEAAVSDLQIPGVVRSAARDDVSARDEERLDLLDPAVWRAPVLAPQRAGPPDRQPWRRHPDPASPRCEPDTQAASQASHWLDEMQHSGDHAETDHRSA